MNRDCCPDCGGPVHWCLARTDLGPHAACVCDLGTCRWCGAQIEAPAPRAPRCMGRAPLLLSHGGGIDGDGDNGPPHWVPTF